MTVSEDSPYYNYPELNFEYEAALIEKELQNTPCTTRYPAPTDPASIALRQAAAQTLRDIRDNPGVYGKDDWLLAKDQLLKLIALLAVDRMLSYDHGIDWSYGKTHYDDVKIGTLSDKHPPEFVKVCLMGEIMPWLTPKSEAARAT